MTPISYHPDIPDACPPDTSQPAKGVIFRAIPEMPIQPAHFLSNVELGKGSYSQKNCKHWGLSVWVTEADVVHAREMFPNSFARQHIVRTQLAPEDGVMMHTASNKQPQHHTFWKAHELDLCARSTIAFEPEGP